MAQEIEFASIPNTQPVAVPSTLALILGEVARSSPPLKEFKEFLRIRNLYDKNTFQTLLKFLDLRIVQERVVLGPVAKRLFEAEDEGKVRRILAERLIETNPLLAKYCLEAMDTEHGGRLHSTNELYRMITSYVYPGKKPTLPSFRAWTEWAVAAALFKLVGIRWGLGELGRELLPRLRAIEVEEFLEEEKSEELREEAAVESVPRIEEPQEVRLIEAVEKASEPGPIATSLDTQRPFVPRPPTVAERQVPRRAVSSEAELDDTRQALCAWYETYPGRRPLRMAAFGLDPASKAPMLWHEAAYVALMYGRGISNKAIGRALAAFREKAILQALARNRMPLDSLHAIMAKDPGLVTACEAAVHLPRIFGALEDLGNVVKAEEPRELLWGLWRLLYEPVSPLAPFVFARFLWEGGRLRESVGAAGFVPEFLVRENGFRIGFCDRIHASNFTELLDISLSLAQSFGPPIFEGPLAQVHEAFGCSFACSRVYVCPLPFCREKNEIGRL